MILAAKLPYKLNETHLINVEYTHIDWSSLYDRMK